MIISSIATAQYVTDAGNDATTPLHLMKPDYSTPYGETTRDKVKAVLDRVYTYLEARQQFCCAWLWPGVTGWCRNIPAARETSFRDQ